MESASKGKAKRRHLSASACVSLSESREGSRPLSDPQLVPRSSMDPNRGLYPRTPTKRRRRVSEGADSNQRCISDFYPVTSALSSSPQRTVPVQGSQPQGSQPHEEDSTPVKLRRALELEAKDQEKILEEEEDYMAGITEDMFSDDDDFEREGLMPSKTKPVCVAAGAGCSSWSGQATASTSRRLQMPGTCVDKAKGEDVGDEAEPLPDPLFGLLGVQQGLLVPQGCLQDLPEEVLRQVFGLLPASTLYSCVQLVCRAWRDIVTDPTFVPWKKLYYRYQRREPAAVKELDSTLRENHLIKDELSLVNMIRYMSNFKHSKRVDLEYVLHSVSTHRLYAQALACITYLKSAQPPCKLECVMSAVPTFKAGPSPWCMMTVMLLLSDGVEDVLQLAYLLRCSNCLLSPEGPSEFLWTVATLLLAMKDKGEYICARLHYSIYYVLQMLENAPVTLPAEVSPGASGMRVTQEQQVILKHDIQPNHIVKIMAFAGTGKTTTLVQYARLRPNLRFLYVAFNKSVQVHAQRSFPQNVECKTVHSMAFHAVGKRYQQLRKLCSLVRPFSVAWVLPKGWGGFIYAKLVTQTINNFCASQDDRITTHHVPWQHRNTCGVIVQTEADKKVMLSSLAQDVWNKMVELKPTRELAHHLTHDGYLKLWQLQKPVLEGYDVIFIDEAQDCTPAIMSILLSQSCGKILVGDPHQQIYTFRGAVNALYTVPHTHLYYLTQSFRFGPEIAFVGATILHVCKGVKKTLVGTLKKGNVCGTSEPEGQVAILSRCNTSVFSEAVRLTDANPHCRIHIIGGVDSFGLKRIMDIWVLMQSEDKRKKESLTINDSFIRGFTREKLGGYSGLKRYAQNTEDHELEAKLEVVERFRTRIPELVKRLYERHEGYTPHADYVLGTVHKAKGLEFDSVMVTDDFMKIAAPRHDPNRSFPGNAPTDEWNLLYVAVTRAKKNLTLSPSLCNILTMAGEYFLRSELTSTLQQQSPSLSCCVRNCPNLLDTRCPLSMRKLPVRVCLPHTDTQGPVCVGCVQNRLGPMAFLLEHQDRMWSHQQAHFPDEQEEVPINRDGDLGRVLRIMFRDLM